MITGELVRWGAEVCDDEFAEGGPAILSLDGAVAFELSELEAFMEAPDVGVVL